MLLLLKYTLDLLLEHRKNCECWPVSLFIVSSLWLSWLEVLICLYVHKIPLVAIVKSVKLFFIKEINLFDKLSKFVNIVNNVNQKYISVSSKIVDTLPRLPKLWTNVRNVSILSTDLFSFFKNCQKNSMCIWLPGREGQSQR